LSCALSAVVRRRAMIAALYLIGSSQKQPFELSAGDWAK
jgi:hypothetical protein